MQERSSESKKLFNASIADISEFGLVTIKFDADVLNYLKLNSSNLNVSISIMNELPMESKFNQELANFTWNITKVEKDEI